MANGNNVFNNSVAYQIYPRSFKDTDANGVGDLAGITQKLEYLKWLGVDVVWMSPFYPSPMSDFGYDVTDYTEVDPLFGTLNDFDNLLKQAHRLDIKILIDFVLNHTSNEHSWFKQSRQNTTNGKRDWYIWQKPHPHNAPPNNWLSAFGGSAWELDELTGEYYLHTFLRSQPDLNWRNPEVRKAMHEVMRFWLDRGVDGFRLDAVNWLAKDSSMTDDPYRTAFDPHSEDPYGSLEHVNSSRNPELYEYLRDLADLVRKYPGTCLIAEAVPEKNNDIESYIKFYEFVDSDIFAPFNFAPISLPWKAHAYKEYIDTFQARLKNYPPVYTFGNHDSSRLASRLGPQQARSAAVLSLTLPGMPFIYYGDELGLENGNLSEEVLKDPVRGFTYDNVGRDRARTPMQWDAQMNAGFSSAMSWLPVNNDYKERNVTNQQNDRHSILCLYRDLIKIRHTYEALLHGKYEPLKSNNPQVFMFGRYTEKQKIIIVINYSDEKQVYPHISGSLLVSTHSKEASNNQLHPYEARVFILHE